MGRERRRVAREQALKTRDDLVKSRKPPVIEVVSKDNMSDDEAKRATKAVREAAPLFVGTLRGAGVDVCYYIRRRLDEIMPASKVPYRRRKYWSVVAAHGLVGSTAHTSSVMVRMGNMFFLCLLN